MNFFLLQNMKYHIDFQKQGGLLNETDVRQSAIHWSFCLVAWACYEIQVGLLKSLIEKLSPHKGLYMRLRSQHGSFLVIEQIFWLKTMVICICTHNNKIMFPPFSFLFVFLRGVGTICGKSVKSLIGTSLCAMSWSWMKRCDLQTCVSLQ